VRASSLWGCAQTLTLLEFGVWLKSEFFGAVVHFSKSKSWTTLPRLQVTSSQVFQFHFQGVQSPGKYAAKGSDLLQWYVGYIEIISWVRLVFTSFELMGVFCMAVC
jgi:hypothetical protein